MTSSPSCLRAAAAAALVVAWAVPVCAQRGAPASPPVQAVPVVAGYAAVLQALDPARPESVITARDAALASYAKADSATADAVFRQFEVFYDRALRAVPFVPLYSPLDVLLSEICRPRSWHARPPRRMHFSLRRGRTTRRAAANTGRR